MNESELYKKIAVFYDFIFKVVGYNNFLKFVVDKISLLPGSRVLDVGCGTGLSTKILEKKFNGEIVCVDNSEEMILKCMRKIKCAKFVLGDFNDKSTFVDLKKKKKVFLKDGSFDFILSAGAISEYSDLEKSLPLVFSLLKKDSCFLNVGIRKNILNKFTGFIWRYKACSPEDFISRCRSAGFGRTREIKVPFKMFYLRHRYFVVVARK